MSTGLAKQAAAALQRLASVHADTATKLEAAVTVRGELEQRAAAAEGRAEEAEARLATANTNEKVRGAERALNPACLPSPASRPARR